MAIDKIFSFIAGISWGRVDMKRNRGVIENFFDASVIKKHLNIEITYKNKNVEGRTLNYTHEAKHRK